MLYQFQEYAKAINQNHSKDISNSPLDVDPAAKMVAFNFERNFDPDGPYTVICGGAARGGSSILPFLLTRLGVPMGTFEADNYEDIEMLRSRQNTERLLEVIGRRNAKHDRWGFKIPSLRRGQYGFFDAHLRNPLYIFIFRNPLLTAQSVIARANVANFSNDQRGFSTALQGSLQSYIEFTVFIRQTTSPCILMPMEQLKRTPRECVAFLDRALQLNSDPALLEKLATDASESGYKPRAQT